MAVRASADGRRQSPSLRRCSSPTSSYAPVIFGATFAVRSHATKPLPPIIVARRTALNPATLSLSLPLPKDGSPHSCITETENLQLPRDDLSDKPIHNSRVWLTDGSSHEGHSGVVYCGCAAGQPPEKVIAPTFSAQPAELVALTGARKRAKGKEVTICTDSQYVFSTPFYFAAQWKRRGVATAAGKPVTHAQLFLELLHAAQLLSKGAICKCSAHKQGLGDISRGNALTYASLPEFQQIWTLTL